jgi:arylsulfatase A-like enzyme
MQLLRLASVYCLLGLTPGCGTQERPPSVLLITLDTTRADSIGCYGRENAGTPHMDALAERGTLFERVLAPVPITLPSHTSLMTGSYPPYHGVRDNGMYSVAPELHTLAEEFTASGRRTAAFVSAFPLLATFGLDAGFEVYDDKVAVDAGGRSGLLMERSSGTTVDHATLWLEHLGRDESFFTWVHLFDPHFPYEPAAPFGEQFASDPYQGEIAAVDAAIGRLLKSLEDAGRLEDTIIVVTADHGEGRGEHGEDTHSMLVYDSTLHVPLILAGPGVEGNGHRVSEAASLIDVAPTVAALAGLALDFQGHGARDLSRERASIDGLEAPRAIYFESLYARDHNGWSELVGVEVDGWKYVQAPLAVDSEAPGRGHELYSVGSDPREQSNLAEGNVPKRQELEARLGQLLETLPPERSFDAERELQGEDQAALEALGYTDSDLASANEGETGGHVAAPDPRLAIGAITWMDRMGAALAARDFGAARSAQAKVAVADPGGVASFESEGLLAQALGSPGGPGGRADLERALVAFESASALLPGRRGLHQRQAEVLLLLQRHEEGLIACRRALALAPSTSALRAIEQHLVRNLSEAIAGHTARGESASAARLQALIDG